MSSHNNEEKWTTGWFLTFPLPRHPAAPPGTAQQASAVFWRLQEEVAVIS